MYAKQTIEQSVTHLKTNIEHGLTIEETNHRIKKYGYNLLKDDDKKTWYQMLLEQLNDPLIYVLFIAAAASVFLKEAADAVIILIVVAINAVVGMIQEGKAQKALESLKQLSSPHALVLRNEKLERIEASHLVPGDVVYLEAGDMVPADLRLISTTNLEIDESALTGESTSVSKDAMHVCLEDCPIADRINMAYMSTGVQKGRGQGIVTATGMNTEIGKIAGILHKTKNDATPLQKRLGDMGRLLSIVAVILCIGLFIIAVLQKRNIPEMLMTAISLAVAAVPEGLPAIVTIVLALSVSRMVRVQTIIRRLPCVETLGSVNVVCSDKTGTLTKNQMSVVSCFINMKMYGINEITVSQCREFFKGFVLCGDAFIQGEKRFGDPTELALIDMGNKVGLNKSILEKTYLRIHEIPFDSNRKLMSTIHKDKDGYVMYTKGSADILLNRCSSILQDGQVRPISSTDKKAILETLEYMSCQALRVLALAQKKVDSVGKADEKDEYDLTFVGLAGMIDPPRQEAAEAVAEFKQAGVRTIMITGDHADTALAIAKPLGIAATKEECMTGKQLDEMDDESLLRKINRVHVFARVSPEHKVRIVNILKKMGHIVAMTGDGVNDAPALKAADIGIAMGKNGTDTARSCADMVLVDDNFATIKKAIEEGRAIYGNIKKAILFLLSSNFGEIITMFTAVLLGLATPLKASHILWVNLLTDTLPALALGTDKNDTMLLMQRPPRDAKESLFADGGLFCTLFYGSLIAFVSLAAFLMLPIGILKGGNMSVTVRGLAGLLKDPILLARCQTYAFTVLGMSQLFHAWGMRNVEISIFKMNPLQNKLMILSLLLGTFLQIVVTRIPFLVQMFGTMTLSFFEWLYLLFFAIMPLVAHELLIILKKKPS